MNALVTDRMRIVTTYIPEAWSRTLEECGLSHKYPFLVNDISFGSPIGNPPNLSYTFIPENMPTALQHPEVVESFIEEERSLGRVSGPYTITEAFVFFGGHFRTAPIGFVEKEPLSAKWRMIRNLSAVDCFGASTNGWLDAADDPITWYSCAAMADIVSTFPLSDGGFFLEDVVVTCETSKLGHLSPLVWWGARFWRQLLLFLLHM
jgi:hypothetical protein